MDENQPHAAAPGAWLTANPLSAAISASISSKAWAALSEIRSRLEPCATVGGRMAGDQKAAAIQFGGEDKRFGLAAHDARGRSGWRSRRNSTPAPRSARAKIFRAGKQRLALMGHLRNQGEGGVDRAQHGGGQAGAVHQSAAALDQEIADCPPSQAT